MDTTNSNLRYDSANDDASADEKHSIQTYLSDMLALERHIRLPLDRQTQMDDMTQYADATRLVNTLRGISDDHVRALQTALDENGGHAASGIKSAWSQLLGAGAAAVEGVRKTKVSKSLRDDYTALALAAISYTMLNTTALGLGDARTAALAQRHLNDYAPLIAEIGNAMPDIVLQELRDDGVAVDPSVATAAVDNNRQAWRSV